MVFFDEALLSAALWAQGNRENLDSEATFLRDLSGRIRLILPPAAKTLDDERLTALHESLGVYSPSRLRVALSVEQEEWDELRKARVRVASSAVEGSLPIYLIERLAVEQLWEAPVVPREEQGVPRITFFGIKGGVGRSTALVATAQHWAREGLRVLVVDLDLESPGITSSLLPVEALPDRGVADWLIEEPFGQAEEVLSSMYNFSPLGDVSGTAGEIIVVPALGRVSTPLSEPTDQLDVLLRDGSYVSKLGRLYASLSGKDLATRIDLMLISLEKQLMPDVILLDSRAGLHEISAATIPRLRSAVLLFAGANDQTWLGYRLLFSCWQRDKQVTSPFREQLQVVASMVPETERKDYIDELTQKSYDTFAAFLYEQEQSVDGIYFNRQLNDKLAPHYPLSIYWRRELMAWEPRSSESLTQEQFDAAFKSFLKGVDGIVNLSKPASRSML